jgi:hypothetical protein
MIIRVFKNNIELELPHFDSTMPIVEGNLWGGNFKRENLNFKQQVN